MSVFDRRPNRLAAAIRSGVMGWGLLTPHPPQQMVWENIPSKCLVNHQHLQSAISHHWITNNHWHSSSSDLSSTINWQHLPKFPYDTLRRHTTPSRRPQCTTARATWRSAPRARVAVGRHPPRRPAPVYAAAHPPALPLPATPTFRARLSPAHNPYPTIVPPLLGRVHLPRSYCHLLSVLEAPKRREH